MTLREADEAAQKRLPVIYQGIEYLRISETGYRYNDKGERHGFVQLLDKCGHSVTYAEPGRRRYGAEYEVGKKTDTKPTKTRNGG